MLKTNSKQARQAIKDYIWRKVEEECNINGELVPCSLHDIASVILDECDRVAPNGNRQAAFEYYASGIPCSIFDYYAPTSQTQSAMEILKDILQETEEQAQRYTWQQAEQILTYMIYSELLKARK